MTRSSLCDFRWLRQQVSIDQVLAAYGLLGSLKRYGDYLRGPCPLHRGDNPTAFRAHLGRGLWYCYTACRGGGDTVELVRRIELCSYADAATHLLRIAASPVIDATLPPRSNDEHAARPFIPFTRRLPLNPHVPFLQQDKAITAQTAAHFDAGTTETSPFLHRTVAIRLHDPHGRPLGYCGRRLDPSAIERWGKWRFPRAFPKAGCLFNAHRAYAARASGVVVVEGPWAVLRLAQASFPSAVALLGTQLSTLHRDWLAHAPDILLLLDGDTTGRTAARRIARQLHRLTRLHIHDLADASEPEDLSDPELANLVRSYLAP